MPEIGTLRSMSGDRKRNHGKPDCGGGAKVPPESTGSLPLPRLSSTLLEPAKMSDGCSAKPPFDS